MPMPGLAAFRTIPAPTERLRKAAEAEDWGAKVALVVPDGDQEEPHLSLLEAMAAMTVLKSSLSQSNVIGSQSSYGRAPAATSRHLPSALRVCAHLTDALQINLLPSSMHGCHSDHKAM